MGAEKQQPDDKIQSEGRKDNAAQHLNAAPDNAGAERYPPTNKDDSIDTAGGEKRSFEGVENPQPRQGAGDGGPDPSVNQGRMGPGADPAEGKR
jgi:hypothetical protein